MLLQLKQGDSIMFLGIILVPFLIDVDAKCLSKYVNDICGTSGVLYDCQHQQMKSVPRNISSEVIAVDLSYNNITSLKNADFEGLETLKVLSIIGNKLQLIEMNALQYLTQLCILDLGLNDITKDSIQEGAFRNLRSLKDLRMPFNPFSDEGYPDTEIGRLTSLRNLSLDVIPHLHFSTEFQNLKRLQYLEITSSNNFIFNNYSFKNLENLSIEYLNFRFSANCACEHNFEDMLWPFSSLKGLSFHTYCGLQYVLRSLKRLQTHRMDYINFEHSSPSNGEPVLLKDDDVAFLKNICVKSFSIQDTNTVRIPPLYPSRFIKCIEKIDLSHNSLNKFNTLFMFLQASQIRVIDFSHLTDCRISRRNLKDSKGNLEQLYVNMTLSSSLEEIDLSYSYVDPYVEIMQLKVFGTNLKTLNLSYIGFPLCSYHNIELYLPSLRIIDITGCSCGNLYLKFLKNFHSLIEVHMRKTNLNNGLSNDVNGVFLKGLSKLKMADFAENGLDELHPNLFRSQTSSMKVLIHSNNLFSIIPRTLLLIPLINFLDFRSNKLASFSEESISVINSLPDIMIDIRDNPLDCSCSALTSLKWMRENRRKFVHLNKTDCTEDPLKTLHEILTNVQALELKCISQLWLDISISILSLTFLILLVITIMYRYRMVLCYGILRIKFFWRRGFALNYTQTSATFDAYISYSPVDSIFLSLHLYPKLQTENLRISFQDKDFEPGSAFSEEVVAFINMSKCVVFVVTETFMKYDWGTYEIQVAKIHAIHKNARILLIIKNDIGVEDLPRDLLYIWWKIKPIMWSESNNASKREKSWRKLIKPIKES